MSAENLFAKAGGIRRGLKETTEAVGGAEIETSPSLAAVISGFPHRFLEEVGILVRGEREQVRITVSQDKYEILKAAFAWANEDEGTQNKVLADLYPVIYRLIQASVTSSVDIAQVLQPDENLLNLCAKNFPPLKNLVDFVKQGGELTAADQENLSVVARFIFERLQRAGDPHTQLWQLQGWTPDNMFVAPDS